MLFILLCCLIDRAVALPSDGMDGPRNFKGSNTAHWPFTLLNLSGRRRSFQSINNLYLF